MILMLTAIFLSVTVFAFLITSIVYRKNFSRGRQIKKQVEAFTENTINEVKSPAPLILQEDPSKFPTLNRLVGKAQFSKKVQNFLQQADSSMKVGDLIVLVLSFTFMGILMSLLMKNPIIKIVLILFVGALPVIRIKMKGTKRLKAFIREFPDALDMMTSAIRAGHALNQSLQLVGTEAPDPVGIEFKKTFEQYNLGLTLHDALYNLTERMNSLDLKLFVTAVLLQRETGGNLTEILENIGYTIRERFKLIGQIRTYTAQGRMSAWILGLLPIFFVLIISMLNPTYLQPLFKDPLGHFLIGIASFLQILGFVIIQKIIKIKYQ